MRGDRRIVSRQTRFIEGRSNVGGLFIFKLHQKVELHTHQTSDAITIDEAPSSIQLSADFPDICQHQAR